MNYSPAFEFGFVCGRYGHAHLGHKLLMDKGLQLCEKLYVAVGSAQEKGTLRNPFSVETRIKVIKGMYSDLSEERLVVDGIDDMSNELNTSTTWGTYLKTHIENKFNVFPDLILYGSEGNRSKWFKEEDMANTYELIVPRDLIPVSGTKMRGFLVIDDKESWKRNVPESIHQMYASLREELMATQVYKEIYDKVVRNKCVDMNSFMGTYNIYVEEDRKRKIEQLKQLQK